MSTSELFAGLAGERLRGRCVWLGVALLASIGFPYEVVEGQAQFLWQLFDELPLAGVLAALAPALAGVVVLLARLFAKNATGLAIMVLAALVGAAVCNKIGSDASTWGVLPLPQGLALRGPTALLSLAAAAAGANLSYREPTRRSARALLLVSFAAALFFYAWPGRTEAPGATVARNLAAIPDLPTLHFQVGAATLAFVALWPAIVALSGLIHLRRPAERSPSVVGIIGMFGFPVLLLMMVFAWALRVGVSALLFAALGAALLLGTVLAAMAGAFELLGERLADPEEDERPQRDSLEEAIEREAEAVRRGGSSAVRTVAVSAAAVALCAGGQWLLARPPPKGITWQLAERSEAADELFGLRIPRWSAARARWQRLLRGQSSAAALLEVKAKSREMIGAAKGVEPMLGARLEVLAQAGDRVDVSARSWYRLVGEVNLAARSARLPYYLDPRVSIRKTKDGLERHLVVASYRVARVRQFDASGERHALLHVRELDGDGTPHRINLLGFSRDLQPFALVALDAVAAHERELGELARGSSRLDAPGRPTCGEGLAPRRIAALDRCGELLARLVTELGPRFPEALLAATERHELQHQMDGPLLNLAAPVVRKLGAYRDDARERVNRELSAHLSEVTVPLAPKLALVTPFHAAVSREGSIYHLAGVLLFEALTGREVRKRSGSVDLDELTRALDELAAMTDSELSRRASAAWEGLYGAPLAEPRLVEESTAPDLQDLRNAR